MQVDIFLMPMSDGKPVHTGLDLPAVPDCAEILLVGSTSYQVRHRIWSLDPAGTGRLRVRLWVSEWLIPKAMRP